MRYLLVGLLLAGFFFKQAVADETSADAAFERLCTDSGYQEGSNEFDRCVRNFHKNGAAHENENGSATPKITPQATSENLVDSSSGDAAKPAPAPASKNNGKSDAEIFCDNYDYTKGSTGYLQCIEFAVAEGYAKDVPVTDGRRKKKTRQ